MVPEQVQAQQNRVDLPLSFLRIPHIQKIHVCANDRLVVLVLVELVLFPHWDLPRDRGLFTKKSTC